MSLNTLTATVVSRHPSLAYFNRILNEELEYLLNNTREMTLFLPVDAAWANLDPIERLYLESDYATDDLYRILNMHAVQKGVTWSESFNPAINCELNMLISSITYSRLSSDDHIRQ
jgi:solute carrier family 25 (mitochondrial carnitine/acylcarnitine transporter), member 20/29